MRRYLSGSGTRFKRPHGQLICHRRTATAVNPPFDPTLYGTLARWYKADAQSFTDGQLIASLADSSANLDPAVQTDAAQQPAFRTNVVNGLPAIRFDGGRVLTFTGVSSAAGTVFIVARKFPIANSSVVISHSGNTGVVGGGFLSIATAADSGTPFAQTQTYQNSTNGPAQAVDQFALYALTWDATSNVVSVNNVDGTPLTGLSGNTLNLDQIGKLAQDQTYQLQGDIAEVMFFSTKVSSTDRATIWTSYFQPKYFPTMATVAVNNASLLAGLSPANWEISGSSYLRTIYPGAYFKVGFTGTSLSMTVDMAAMVSASTPPTRYPQIAWSIDGGPMQYRQLESRFSTYSLAGGLADATHSIKLAMFSSDAYTARWIGTSALKITSLSVVSGKALTNATLLSGQVLFFGDSITEGAWSLGSSADLSKYSLYENGLSAYSDLIGTYLNREVGKCALGGQSWNSVFNSDIPSLVNGYNLVLSGVSRTFGTPDYVFVNMGTNGGPSDATQVQTFITNLRAAVGAACKIRMIVPFSQAAVATITAGYNAYVAAVPSDTKVALIDLGTSGANIVAAHTYDGTHPDITGHQLLAAAIEPLIN